MKLEIRWKALVVFFALSLLATHLIAQEKISSSELLNNVGKTVTICDRVFDVRYFQNSVTLLNFGGRFPNQKFTGVISNRDRSNFLVAPETVYNNKELCITGVVELYEGKPQIRISSPTALVEVSDSVANANRNIVPRTSPIRIEKPATPVITIVPSTPVSRPRTSGLVYHAGFSVGAMNSLADIGRKKSLVFPASIDWKSTRLNASIYGGVMFNKRLGARAELTYGRVGADDKNGRYTERDLNYRSSIVELAAIGEYYFLADKTIAPYVMAGIGVFNFKPQTHFNGSWIDVKPLRLEGQGFIEYPDRKEYKTTQLSVPIGLGFKYDINRTVTLRFEGLYRYTTTDYLDDASKLSIDQRLFSKYLSPEDAALATAITSRHPNVISRGGSATKDKFLTMNVKVGFRLWR